jgi:hypothetical protein
MGAERSPILRHVRLSFHLFRKEPMPRRETMQARTG